MNNDASITRPKLLRVFCSCVLILIFSACTVTFALMAVYGPSVYKSLMATYYVMRADGHYRNLAFEEAITDYTNAIELKPDFYEAWVYRGSAYAHLENYEHAKLDFKAAIDLYPSQANAYNSLCWYGSLLGDARNVLSACEQGVNIEPNSPHVRDSRGLARALTGDYEGAILDFQFFVDQARMDASIAPAEARERIRWISALKKGVDPFNAAELQKLLDHDTLPEENPSINV